MPNLFTTEEIGEIKQSLSSSVPKGASDSSDPIYDYFLDKVRSNLHVVLCMSPVGDSFRNRLRMFPTIVNCTSIDYFSDWPEDALLEVALKYLEDVDLGSDAVKRSVSQVFVAVHTSVLDISKKMIQELKRYNYVIINFHINCFNYNFPGYAN